ncbi:MAG TPA: hypothetical protein VGK58_15660 [Lacipirellulaceae bacterium]
MTNQHPRLRSHVRKGKNGKTRVYYFYDMRHAGEPDIALGSDYAEALRQWDAIHNHKPRIAGTLQEAFEKFEAEVIPTLSAGNAKNYRSHVAAIKPPMGKATWAMIDQPALWAYYDRRTNKGQAKKEIKTLGYIWNWALRWGMTRLPNPTTGMRIDGYGAREFEVTDDLFGAVYAQAEPMLKDCMDLATATGMRLTDCRQVQLPRGDVLHLKAKKTRKKTDFDLSLSQVLPALIERRRALSGALHTMLLSMPDGKPVTVAMLRGAYDRARERAAIVAYIANDDEFARQIKSMILRDCRKRAADLASDLSEASKLLQHSSEAVTAIHYRTRPTKVRPVR